MIRSDSPGILRAAKAALAGASVMALSLGATGQENSPASAPRPGGLVILDFKPAMDDLMTMLVQPRHIKLYYAGQAKNWTLAGFELNELRAGLARIGRTIPNYRGQSVDNAVASIITDPIKSVDAAIKAQDATKFTAAYQEMTGACNACHAGMEHHFLVIKVPEANSYQDQEFRP
jgi:hypothetical protein